MHKTILEKQFRTSPSKYFKLFLNGYMLVDSGVVTELSISIFNILLHLYFV